MKAIEFENINLKIGDHQILDNVTFDIEQGVIFGLIGHNGAGKTSLLRILLGLTKGYHGNIRIFSSEKLDEQRIRIGAVMDSLTMDKSLTAAQYIHRISYMLGQDSADAEQDLLARVGLEDVGPKTISKYSLGMKRRLLIAGALVGEPKILVLDEPFNGIDPEGMAMLRLVLQQLASEGITVLVTSHNIPELIKLSDAFGVMHKGRFVDKITARDLELRYCEKTVFKTDKPKVFMDRIKEKYPSLDCSANSPGEISVSGELSSQQCSEIAGLPGTNVSDYYRSKMSEEEILLWRMNGFVS